MELEGTELVSPVHKFLFLSVETLVLSALLIFLLSRVIEALCSNAVE